MIRDTTHRAHLVLDESVETERDRTILLVEDDPEDVMLFREFLADSQSMSSLPKRWTVVTAGRLDEALSIVEERSVDLALVDLGLPDSGGLESFRAIRKAVPKVPIVILTGHGDDRHAARAIREGAQDYVAKHGLTPEGLRRAIVHALERHGLQEEIRRRDEMLRHADRVQTVGRLAGGVAHEFNNLLTTIKGYATILAGDSTLSETQRECVEEIREAATRSATITRELLSFSRRQELDRQAMEPRDVCESVLALLEPLLTNAYSIDFEPSDDRSAVFVDRGLLEQSIVSLILNARDAMPAGGRIVVRCGIVVGEFPKRLDRLSPDTYAVIEVEDDGVGMSDETLEHAFDPFFTTKEVGEGTGLGLSQVEGYIDQSGGGIDIESERGEGTTVRIYLPVVDDTTSEERESTPSLEDSA